jgi:hypothetical protein
LGAAAGYFAGTPARNDLRVQRSEALAKVDVLTKQAETNRADLAAAQATVATLTEERDQLLANASAVALVSKARAYVDMNLDSTYVDQLAQAGTDLSSYDEVLALLGEDMTLTEWVNYSGFRAAERAVYATEDAPLIDAWNTWLDAEVGTPEDDAAWSEVLLRLDQLALTTSDIG